MIRRILAYFIVILIGLGAAYADKQEKVYVIPIKGEINHAVFTYLEKSIQEAEKDKATQIIFEIDTYGGTIDSALKISKLMLSTSVSTVSYITDNAISAGVLIAISSDKVVANKTINIGSAETRPKEEKYISFWAGELRSIAEQKGRNSDIIAGMADADVEIEGIKQKGKLLNFTATEALKHGVVDKIVDDRQGLYEYLQVKQSDVVELKYDYKTNIARFTNSVAVSSILIALGIIGIVGEVFTAGFGLFGTIGILSFALFFAGRVLSGHAGWGVLILFSAVILLLGIEIAIPGFGIPGIAGIGCIILSILLGSANPLNAGISFSIGLLISIVGLFLVFKYAPRNRLFDNIILKTELKNDIGYKTYRSEEIDIIGLEGEAITLLRPAGTVIIADKRFDVVTEGEFIPMGTKIKVVNVEGSRIVVRKVL